MYSFKNQAHARMLRAQQRYKSAKIFVETAKTYTAKDISVMAARELLRAYDELCESTNNLAWMVYPYYGRANPIHCSVVTESAGTVQFTGDYLACCEFKRADKKYGKFLRVIIHSNRRQHETN